MVADVAYGVDTLAFTLLADDTSTARVILAIEHLESSAGVDGV
jgi:hypothetical protein